jgi:two-component system CheB/CheR fusion protein
MARDGIRHELAAAIRKSRLQRKSVVVEGMRIKTDGGYRRLTMTITPMRKSEGVEDLLMVAFEDIANEKLKPAKSRSAHAPRDAPGGSRLEQELKSSQEHLQTTIEELETSNEELQSTNEELQSSTEELETSKEELQSLNEELVTVNAELEGKIEELSRANDEIKNLLDSTKIATIFLDDQLCINRFTSEASKIINLIPGDIGRPISHIVSNLEHVTLSEEAQEVIDSLVTKEHPVRTKEGRWYLSRIIPYRTLDNQIGGVVITFTDITEQKMPKR